jgi:5-methyltetrahydropteroyltriglutamate--homocysteine methyltransferase
MKQSTDRILSTFVGSLVRPAELRALNDARQRGEAVDERAYEQVLRRSVAEAVRRQVEVGLDVVSDGEFGKSHWADYVLQRVNGFETRPAPPGAGVYNKIGKDRERFADYYSQEQVGEWTARVIACVGPITYNRAALLRDIDNFKAALQQVQVEEAFMPVVAPASFIREARNEYYRTEEEYVYAIADALREEYTTILEAGLLLQVDDAVLATMWNLMQDDGLAAYRRWAQLRIEALNHALAGLPQDRIRYHVCWGSWPGPHTTDIPLRDIVDLVLQANVGAHALEAGNPRHAHEWHVWQETKLPEGRLLLPGLISHSTSVVEHPELVAERIVRFARLVGREHVIASSDCGFAQSQGLQRVYPSIMWAKLQALAEGARLASRELWAR